MSVVKIVSYVVASSAVAFAGDYTVGTKSESPVVAAAKTVKTVPATVDVDAPVVKRAITKEGDSLADQLSDAEKKINKLQSMNDSLARQIEQMNLPLPASTTYPELIGRIDKLPTTFINQQLAYLFDEEYIASIQDPHAFSKQLVDVVLSDHAEDVSSGSVNVEFSYSPISGIRPAAASIEIDRYDSVYAHFSSTTDFENAIVKWQHTRSGEILLLRQMRMSESGLSQYVWTKPANGWQVGQYRITVHDMDNGKQLVGSGSFTVEGVRGELADADQITPDRDVIDDLVISGQAVAKQ